MEGFHLIVEEKRINRKIFLEYIIECNNPNEFTSQWKHRARDISWARPSNILRPHNWNFIKFGKPLAKTLA